MDRIRHALGFDAPSHDPSDEQRRLADRQHRIAQRLDRQEQAIDVQMDALRQARRDNRAHR